MTSLHQQKKEWWVFYPLIGLKITDAEHDLEKPVLGDVTFVGKAHVQQIISLLGLNSRMAPGHDHEKTVVYLMQRMCLSQEYDSLLAVRRTGVISDSEREPEMIKEAFARATHIASMLTIAFLANSRERRTCGLVEQVQRDHRNYAMLALKDGSFRYHTGGGCSYTIGGAPDSLKMSRQEIMDVLLSEEMRGLSEVLILGRSRLAASVQRSIAQAAITLSDAVHSGRLSSQLLGAVTTMEVLLTSSQGDKYGNVLKRLGALLGADSTARYDADGVFQARHLYVHQGQNVVRQELAADAISLAMGCILGCPGAAIGFKDKPAFVKYLDLIHQLDGFADALSESERKIVPSLAKHKRALMDVPFFEGRRRERGVEEGRS